MKQPCGWSGPLPAVGTTALCKACGIDIDYGRGRRCQVNGRDWNPARKPVQHVNSGIGTALQKIFGSWWIEAKLCGCADLQLRLDQMTAEQVRQWGELPELIVRNAEHVSGVTGKLIRAAIGINNRLALAVVRKAIETAIVRSSMGNSN